METIAMWASGNRIGRVLGICASVAAGGFAAASAELRPGIIGADDRVTIEDSGSPWDSIGQVNVSGYRSTARCTGTLIRPDVVLTAAHCVWVDGHAVAPADRIHFVAGLRRGSYKGHATAKCLRFLDGWSAGGGAMSARPKAKVPLADFARDAVAIVLNEPLVLPPVSVTETSEVSATTSLVHASYPADRRHVLSADNDCVLGPLRTDLPLWLNDCDTHPASSGGPVFVREGTDLKLAAIMVGAGGGAANVALPASQWRGLAADATCP